MDITKKPYERKPYKTTKVLVGKNNLISIFKERIDDDKGLIKEEIISLYSNIPIEKVFSMPYNVRQKIWDEIRAIKKTLMKEKIIAIVPTPKSVGFELEDELFGKRILKQRTYIYNRIIDVAKAQKIKATYEAIAEGMKKAGKNIVEIAEEEQENKKVFETLEE